MRPMVRPDTYRMSGDNVVVGTIVDGQEGPALVISSASAFVLLPFLLHAIAASGSAEARHAAFFTASSILGGSKP